MRVVWEPSPLGGNFRVLGAHRGGRGLKRRLPKRAGSGHGSPEKPFPWQWAPGAYF